VTHRMIRVRICTNLNPTIAELTAAVEREARKRPEVLRLMTHPGATRSTDRRYVWVGLKPTERLRAGRGRRCAEVNEEQGRPLFGVNGVVRSKRN
jgi:hypothetical protein